MGIAASQARYLSLTARKSNVEFQGQMVNQARTNLANESANIYNEMMRLKAPTVPSPYDYQETKGAFEATLEGKVTEFYINSYEKIAGNEYKNGTDQIPGDGIYNVQFKYYKNGFPQEYMGKAELESFAKADDGTIIPKKIANISDLESTTPDEVKDALTAAGGSVTAKVVYDEIGYEEASNEADYEKTVYEQKIQELHARTEKLQIEDRTLELQLRQLDTEQDALQTELDSVKKVIEKNVESVFKTFQD